MTLPELAPYREGKVAYLTFDDGPDDKNTPAVLDVLKEAGVKATFYVTGVQAKAHPEVLRRIYDEGHAIGNQHWPAVVKGTRVYVPLTVDRKVMESVMRTHHIEGISFSFQPGREVIPYLAPHEIRRLFGGTGPDSDVHHHHHHPEEHPREHVHAD